MSLYDPSLTRHVGSRRVLALGLIGLAAFMAWQAALLRAYIRTDTRPPSWDQAVHLEIAWDYWQAAKAGRYSDIMHLAPKSGMPPFPPLYHMMLARAYRSSDPAHAALWLNWLYLAVLCLAVYGIAYYFRPDFTALCAAVMFACAPAVQELYVTQLVDLSVVALSAVAIWALLWSNEFHEWPGSLAFGALFALGMMHKWTFFSYVVPAYLAGLKNLGLSRCRWKIASAAAIALAGFGPWYWAHLPVLVPRLFQASNDFAVPVWQGAAFLTYLLSSADGLGLMLWALGWLGLAAPHYRRNAGRSWIIPTWVIASYVFWAIVPNRQLRFLLPGLPGLTVLLCAAWPAGIVVATAAFNLFLGANSLLGWIGPARLALPLHELALFPSNPPQKEDWRIADIVTEAQRRADPNRPLANLTLVGNAPYFNGPNFTWTAKRLRLPQVRVRGVNARLCELSEFVVLKDGQLGPSSVISGLPEAAMQITSRKGWFQKAYSEAKRWPLPDGSHAVLFAQRRFALPPMRNDATQFQYYNSNAFTAVDLRLSLGLWDADVGVYPAAWVRASRVELRGLKASRVWAELDGVSLVSASRPPAHEWEDVRLLRLRRLRLRSLQISADDFRSFLESRVHGLSVRRLALEGDRMTLEGTLGGVLISVEADVTLSREPRALVFSLRSVRVGASPVSPALLAGWRRYNVSLDPTPETPFFIDIPSIHLAKGRLTIP